MKNILITASFIAGLLFIACANTTSNTAQEKTPNRNQQDNRTIPQFTPEEIAYNDSIKDIPMDYIIVYKELAADIDNPLIQRIPYIDEIRYNGTQEAGYIEAYSWLCSAVLTQISNRIRIIELDEEDVMFRHTVKLLNKDGKDIIPLIDFPERRAKEDSVWSDVIKFIYKEGIIGDINMYVQPIVHKGDSMVLQMNNDLFKHPLK